MTRRRLSGPAGEVARNPKQRRIPSSQAHDTLNAKAETHTSGPLTWGCRPAASTPEMKANSNSA